jgi:Na+-translocating ferredoxin:NAD+ oxidoreductase RnfE subunit
MSNTNKKLISRLSGLWFRNPLLMSQLSIAPIILVGISLKNALALSLTMAMISIPTLSIISIIGDRISRQYATIIYLLISTCIYIPTGLVIKYLFPDVINSLGIYLPMIVINSIILIRSRAFASKNKLGWVILDSSVYVIVFCIETCLISIVRELLGKGSIMDWDFGWEFTFPALLLPFSGFILVGLFAAIMQKIYNRKKNIFHKDGSVK